MDNLETETARPRSIDDAVSQTQNKTSTNQSDRIFTGTNNNDDSININSQTPRTLELSHRDYTNTPTATRVPYKSNGHIKIK